MDVKNTQNKELKYATGLASGKLEELHLIVPKDVADKFRHVAKKLRKSPNELLE